MENSVLQNLCNSRNGTVNIIAAGPSIFHADVRKFEKNDCIYVNSSALLLPQEYPEERLKIWLSIDRLVLKWSYFWQKVIRNKCMKLCSDDFLKHRDILDKYNCSYFSTRNQPEISNLYDNALCGISSVPASIDLALKIGYSRILLFGVDHCFIQGKSHFWEFYPKAKRPVFVNGTNIPLKQQKEKFESNLPYFAELKKVADKKGVEILNCSARFSQLEIFPKIKTEEGLS